MKQPNSVKTAKVFAIIIAATAILVMVGWAYDVGFLKSISPSWVVMRLMTAVAFLLTAFILYYITEDMEGRTGVAGIVLPLVSFFSAVIMMSLLYSDLLGISTGVENWFAAATGNAAKTPALTRPALPAIFNFILVAVSGIVTVFHPARLKSILSWLGGIIAAIGAFTCSGYLLNLSQLYISIAGINAAMACHASILFVLFGAGLLLLGRQEEATRSHPDQKLPVAELKSPARLLVTLTFVLFTIEMIVMGVFTLLPPMSAWYETLLDSTTITALLFPVLYFLVFRPFKKYDRQQKLLQQQIENSRREWMDIFDTVPDPIFLHDAGFRILRANRAYAKQAGKPFKEIIGQPYWKIFPQLDEPLSSCTRALQKAEVTEDLYLENGEFYTSRSLAVRNEQGAYKNSIHIMHNITERKKIEAEMRIAATAFESQDGMVVTDANNAILRVNRAFTEITGYTAEEVLGKNPRLLKSGRHDAAFYAEMWGSIQHTGAWHGELWNRRKNGEIYPERVTMTAVKDDSGKITHFIATLRDITERKQHEEYLKAQFEYTTKMNTQLVELNKQLSQAQNHLLQSEKMASIGLLAAGVAHEINNPIGYVNSNIGTLEKYLVNIFALLARYEQAEALMQGHGLELEELRQFKNKIDLGYLRDDIKALLAESHQGLERVKKIVIDLKDFSRSGAEEEWAWVDIRQGLESTLSIVWNELKYKCEVEKEYATLPQIYCMPSQLNQVFMNLLVNAAQAIEEYGIITIRTGQENDQVWVEIADTGKGIPAENMPHLFDPFFTTKPVGVGTGLGLSVSYSIVQKHHGRIEVKSEVGKGTAFRVWLPVKQPAQEGHDA